nr:VOC family protein [Streptomyces sp. UH6]
MSRVQLALRVPDLEAAVTFYGKLLGTEPAKLRDGYADFAVAEPPLKLVRLAGVGLATAVENDTTCCHALQDKVWVTGPGSERWEVYVVKADVPAAESPSSQGDACCVSPTETSKEAAAAGACCRPSMAALTRRLGHRPAPSPAVPGRR